MREAMVRELVGGRELLYVRNNRNENWQLEDELPRQVRPAVGEMVHGAEVKMILAAD